MRPLKRTGVAQVGVRRPDGQVLLLERLPGGVPMVELADGAVTLRCVSYRVERVANVTAAAAIAARIAVARAAGAQLQLARAVVVLGRRRRKPRRQRERRRRHDFTHKHG